MPTYCTLSSSRSACTRFLNICDGFSRTLLSLSSTRSSIVRVVSSGEGFSLLRLFKVRSITSQAVLISLAMRANGLLTRTVQTANTHACKHALIHGLNKCVFVLMHYSWKLPLPLHCSDTAFEGLSRSAFVAEQSV